MIRGEPLIFGTGEVSKWENNLIHMEKNNLASNLASIFSENILIFCFLNFCKLFFFL